MIHFPIVAPIMAVHTFTLPIHERFLPFIVVPVYPHP